jgi:syntaxin 1B/2/3
MADRLAAMRAAAATKNAAGPSPPTAGPAGGATAVQVEEEDPMDKCMRIVAEVQDLSRQMTNKTAELRIKSAESLRSIDPKADKTADAVQTIMDDSGNLSKQIKKNLDILQADAKRLNSDPATAAGNAATVKILENQHAHLSRTFLQAMQEYKSAVSEHEAGMRDQTARRIKLKYTDEKGCSITDDEANRMAQEMLDLGVEDALLGQARDKLHEILETREDLKKMERSMRELHQIFNDLAVLINEQSELMDQILVNVQKSVAYVEQGREKLKDAKKYAKKSRKKMCWIVVFIVIVFLFILAIILGFSI